MLRIRVLMVWFCCMSAAYGWDLGALGVFEFKQVQPDVYVMHGPVAAPNPENWGFMNNPAMIETVHGVVVIDPGSSKQIGREVLREIAKITDKPVLAVFSTHIHGDHWLANDAIKAAFPNIKMYAHPVMIKQANGAEGLAWLQLMQTATDGKTAGTRIIAPNIPVQHDMEIDIDGARFRIHAITPAHTDTDIMIEHVQSRTLFLGDNCFHQRLGRFDESASIQGNIKALEYAQALDMVMYVPGHGRSGSAPAAVVPFLTYLRKLQTAVLRGYEEDLEDYEIKAESVKDFSNYHSWFGFAFQFGKHINKMYLEIQAQDF